MDDISLYTNFIHRVLAIYPEKVKGKDIRCSQTGFILDSLTNMEFLCVRAALIAVIRSLNRGAAVGIMIASSNGPWYKNGITLVDFDGVFFPADWISLTEILLNCDDDVPLTIIQLLLQRIPYLTKNAINRCIIAPKYFDCNNIKNKELIPEIISCFRSYDHEDLTMWNAAVHHQDCASIIIGFDTRPKNRFYASIIRNVCSCFFINYKCIGYATLPMLSCIVRTKNFPIDYQDINIDSASEYVDTVVGAFHNLQPFLEKRSSDDNAKLFGFEHSGNLTKFTEKRIYNLKNVYLDLANSVTAPFIIESVMRSRSFKFLSGCKFFNYSSWVLFKRQCDKYPPEVNIIPTENAEFMIDPENTHMEKTIKGLTNMCGVDYVLDCKAFPCELKCEKQLSHCCSFSGVGDRLVFYFKCSIKEEIQIIKGEQFACLYANFFKKVLDNMPWFKYDMKVAVNTFSNSSVRRHIEGAHNNITVINDNDSIVKMRNAVKQADIGIYFTVNGHGSVLFSKRLKCELLNLKQYLSERISSTERCLSIKYNNLHQFYFPCTQAELIEHLDRCMILLNLERLINPTMGDALTNFFAIEFILSYKNITLSDWNFLNVEVDSYQISWSPEIPVFKLPIELVVYKMIIGIIQLNRNYLIGRNIFIRCNLVQLMLDAATRSIPHFNGKTLSIQEREVLKDMESCENIDDDLRQLNVSLDMTAILKSCSKKYICLYPGTLMSSIVVFIQALQNYNSRLVICPEENNTRVKIYAECTSIIRAKMTVLGVMLLFRSHFYERSF
ncbi:hypothetical protein GJ496_003985 [Pomphorhynchus laevis]|nr:hypothetical protein GJ496_003985 [Pomphorhynchus laevis]